MLTAFVKIKINMISYICVKDQRLQTEIWPKTILNDILFIKQTIIVNHVYIKKQLKYLV